MNTTNRSVSRVIPTVRTREGAGFLVRRPAAQMVREGGRMHGFQIWVNLPRTEKMIPPRYQELGPEQIPEGKSDDGKAKVKVIAGSALGVSAAIDTRTPVALLHFTLQPGA